LTTRLEYCTRQPGCQEEPNPSETPVAPPPQIAGRLVWDVTLGLVTVAYLLLALFDDVDSPVLGMVLIILVGRELIQPHLSRR
jgi:hypothetical protein